MARVTWPLLSDCPCVQIVLALLGRERGKASYRTALFELAVDDEYRLELLRKLLSQ